MEKSLVIVESPAKSKTIKKFLGPGFEVMASMGHVKDLPKSRLGVDVAGNFDPEYIAIRKRMKTIKELKAASKKSSTIYLAADPDREGETICWHLSQIFEGKTMYRISMDEITKKGVKEAFENKRNVDMNMVEAQQTRRILDRLVGYSVSPLLWKKVRRGLSAGRVQTVAVRLICERDEEIKSFKPVEYWSIEVLLNVERGGQFWSKLVEWDGQKSEIPNIELSQEIVNKLKNATYSVKETETKEQRKNPLSPYTTSKIQQDASSKLRFSVKKTMMIAQKLYEGLDVGEEGLTGLITYMRTDSVRIASEAQAEALQYIKDVFGSQYCPSQPNQFKSKKSIQDAHECIRPTSVARNPDEIKGYLDKDEYKLYKLIWQRFLASQMNPAIFEIFTANINGDKGLFRTIWNTIKFQGYLAIYQEDEADGDQNGDMAEKEEINVKMNLVKGDLLTLVEIKPAQHFTQPSAAFNDASLIKVLEEKGIGRPSTYAPIISTIVERGYVEKLEGRLYPTSLGKIVNELLIDNFADIFNVEYTALMEDELDKIEEGQLKRTDVLGAFYGAFKKDVDAAKETMRDVKSEMETQTDEICEKCGKPMSIKWGRFGKFLACTGYPECKNTKQIRDIGDGKFEIKPEEATEEKCPKCNSPMIFKHGRFGKFLACSRYPECKTTKSISLGIKCPKKDCNGDIVPRRTKNRRLFYGCSRYPECDFVTWNKPVKRPCPKCNQPFMVEKYNKGGNNTYTCVNEACGYEEKSNSDIIAA